MVQVAEGIVGFSADLSGVLRSVLVFGAELAPLSVDLAVELGAVGIPASEGGGSDARIEPIVLLPRPDYYAGNGGASRRGGEQHDLGRARYLGFVEVAKYSLLCTEDCASISGASLVSKWHFSNYA